MPNLIGKRREIVLVVTKNMTLARGVPEWAGGGSLFLQQFRSNVFDVAEIPVENILRDNSDGPSQRYSEDNAGG